MKAFFLAIGLSCTVLLAADLDEKSARYHALLLKKPEANALVSRFLDAWLETADQPALLALLQQRADSGTAADWRVLAALSEFTGNDQAALTALDAAVKLTPDDPATRLARAKILAKLVRLDAALADLKIATTDPALDLEATTLSGRLLAQAGRPDDALKAWDTLLAKHPDDLGLREDLIDLLLQENLTDQALVASRKLTDLTKDPYQKAIRRLRTAEILTQANKSAEAAAEYAAILALSAQDSWLERETLALTQKLFASGQDPVAWKKFLTEALAAAPTRTQLHLAMAQQHLVAGETDQALKIHQQLLQTNPGSLPIRQAYIAILQQAGQLKDAAAEVQLLADQHPADLAIWQQLAALYQSLGDQPKLETALAKAIALLPQDATTPIQTAQLYEQFQQPEKARATLETAAKSQGPQSDAADALANFLARHQQLDQAIALWTAAAKTADREGLLRISRALSANGKATEARAVLADRIKDFAADPLLLSALCQAAMLTEQAEETIPHALALLDLAQTPTDTQAAVALATSLIRRAQLEQKIIDQLAAEATPSNPRLCLLAQLHESLGDSLAAQKSLEKAAANDPSHIALFQQIALHEARGDLAAAIATLQQLIAQPGNQKPLLLKQLAALQRRTGNLTEAAATTAQWKSLAPGDKSACFTLAEIFSDQGEPQKATAELRRAAAKFGNDSEIREKLIQSLVDSGTHAEALRLQLQLLDEAESTAAKTKLAPRVAELAQALGREQEMEDLFRKRARDNPTATAPLLVLRELFLTWQRLPEANDLLAQAARLAPTETDLQYQLADQLEATSQTEQAEAILLGLYQQRPAPEALRRLSSFYLRNGDGEKAAALTRQLSLQTNDPRQLESFVLAALQAGQWQAGLDALAAAKSDVSADWRLNYLRAVALEQLGQSDAALKVFIPLLQTQNDLVGLPKPPANPPVRYNSFTVMRPQLDPEQQTLADFSQAINQAYPNDPQNSSYMGGFNSYPNAGARTVCQITLPGDARTLRLYALTHCFGLTASLPTEKRPPILAQISLPELKILPGLLKIAALGPDDRLDPLLAANPTDASLALACLLVKDTALFSQVPLSQLNRRSNQNSRRGRYAVQPETWIGVAEKLLDTAPEVSLRIFWQMGGMYGGNSAEFLKKCLPVALAAFEKLPKNDRKNFVSPFVSGALNLKRSKLNTDVADKILATVTPDIDPADPLHFALDNLTICPKLQAAALAGDYATAVTLTNQFISNINGSSKASLARIRYSPYSRFGYQGSGSDPRIGLVAHWQLAGSIGNFGHLLQSAMTFGCDFLSQYQPRDSSYPRPTPVNPALAALLKDIGASLPAENVAAVPPKFTVTDPPAFLAALEKLDDPLIRLIILDALKFDAEVRAAITALTDPAAKPTVHVLLWSAAYLAAKPTEQVLAYQLAVRAAATNSDPSLVSVANSQLLAIALKLDETSRAAVDLDPARSVALKLAKSTVQESSRKTLAKQLETLGLKDAAARLTKPASPAVAARRSSSYQGSSSRSNSNSNKVSALVRQGNRVAAAQLLYRELVLAINNSKTNGQSFYSSRAMEQITELKLVPDIAANLRPPDTASYKSRAEFIRILCLLGSSVDCSLDLEKLHNEKPDDMDILALYCGVAEPAVAAKLIQPVAANPANDLLDVGQQLLKKDRDRRANTSADLQAELNRWAVVVTLLDAIPAADSPKKNLSWVNYYARQLADNLSFDGFALPKFGRPMPKPTDGASDRDKERYAEAEKAATLRDTTIQAVATAMLKHPGTSSQGFEILSSARSSLKLDDEALCQMALKSLQLTLSASAAADEPENFGLDESEKRWSLISQGNSSSYGSGIEGGILPESFLASFVADHPDREVAASLLEGLPDSLATPLKGWFAYFAKPTADEAASRIKLIQTDPTQSQLFLTANDLASLVPGDLAPAYELLYAAIEPASLLAIAGSSSDPNASYSATNSTAYQRAIIMRWLSAADPVQCWARFRQLATVILGPEKHWPAYATLDEDRMDDPTQPARTRLFILKFLVEPPANRLKFPNFLTHRFLRSIGIPSMPNSSQFERLATEYRYSNSPTHKTAMVKNVIDPMIASNLLLPGPGMVNPDGSLLSVTQLQLEKQEDRNLLGEELLKVTGTSRFWAVVTGAALCKKESSSVVPLLQQEIPSIKKWSATEQMSFAAFLIATWPDLQKSKVAPWLATASKGFKESLESRLVESIEAHRDGRSYQSEQLFARTLALFKTNPARAAAVWDAALTEAAKAPDTTVIPMGGGSSQTNRLEQAYSEMFQTLSYGGRETSSTLTMALRFMLVLGKSPAHRALAEKNSNLNARFDSLFSSIFDRRKELMPPKWKSLADLAPASIIPLFDVLTDQDLKEHPRLMHSLLQTSSYLNSYNAKSVEALEPWFMQEMQSRKPLCTKFARFMLSLNLARSGPSDETKAGAKLLVAASNALLADPALDRANRLVLLANACNYQRDIVLADPKFLTHVQAWIKEPTPLPQQSLDSAASLVRSLSNSQAITPETAGQLATRTIPAILDAFESVQRSEMRKSLLPAWLAMANRSKDKQAIASLVTENLEFFAGDFAHITRLTLDGHPDLAALLVPKLQDITLLESCYLYGGSSNGSINFYFTNELETALPALLAAIPDPQQRYRTECLMHIYHETTDVAKKPFVSRGDRITKLVARFATEAPPQQQARLEILCAIAPGPNNELAAIHRAACGKLLMGDLIEQRQQRGSSGPDRATLQRIDYQISALDRLISIDLNAGDPTSFFSQANSLITLDSNAQYPASDRLEVLFKFFAPRSLAAIKYAPAENQQKLLEQATKFVSTTMEHYSNRMSSYEHAVWRFYLILAYAAAGQGPALEDRWQSQPGIVKQVIRIDFDKASGLNTSSRQWAYQSWKGQPFAIDNHPDAAAELLTALLTDPILSKLEIERRSELGDMVKSGLFSLKTVYDAIDAVPDEVVRKPEFLTEKAAMLAWIAGKPDEADKTYLQAKELAQKTGHTEHLDMLNASHAIMLIDNDRDADAKAVAALVKPDSLNQATRELFASRVKLLNSRMEARLKNPKKEAKPKDADK